LKIQTQTGDFQGKEKIQFEMFDTLLVNPPRSGLKDFLQPLFETANKPKHFIYMSCYPESFKLDAQKLVQAGYALKQAHLVDQFPQTKHFEILSFWQLE
jgi:23S rRNA (uracil1939-C5)-methyltransferase